MDTHRARNWRTFRRRLGIAVLSCAAAMLVSWWYYPSWIKWRHLEAEWDGHPGLVNAIAFSRDGSLLATAGADGTIVIWDNTGRRMKTLTAHDGRVNSIAFAPDGITLASGGEDGMTKLWDITEMQMRSSIRGHDDHVLTVAFAPRGDILVTEGAGDSGIKLWDTSPLKFRAELPIPVSVFSGIVLSPDGRFFATADFIDNYPTLWDTSTGEKVAKLTGDYIGFKYNSIAFSADGLTLATGTRRGQIIIWDVNERRQKLQWQAYLTALEGGLGFLPNGNVLVTVAPGPSGIARAVFPSEISFWSLPDQRQLLRLPMDRRLETADADTVTCIAISPDGGTVGAGHSSGMLRLWKVPRSVTQR